MSNNLQTCTSFSTEHGDLYFKAAIWANKLNAFDFRFSAQQQMSEERKKLEVKLRESQRECVERDEQISKPKQDIESLKTEHSNAETESNTGE